MVCHLHTFNERTVKQISTQIQMADLKLHKAAEYESFFEKIVKNLKI